MGFKFFILFKFNFKIKNRVQFSFNKKRTPSTIKMCKFWRNKYFYISEILYIFLFHFYGLFINRKRKIFFYCYVQITRKNFSHFQRKLNWIKRKIIHQRIQYFTRRTYTKSSFIWDFEQMKRCCLLIRPYFSCYLFKARTMEMRKVLSNFYGGFYSMDISWSEGNL
jgi:hypothetical protein